MKNRTIKILSLMMTVVIIAGLCACSGRKKDNSKLITNRSVTLSTLSSSSTQTDVSAQQATAPEGQKNIIDYLNGSLTKFHNFDYDFNKNVTTVLNSFSAGSLGEIEGANETFASTLKNACADMMGAGSLDTSYFVGDDLTEAFPLKAIKDEDVQSASASADGGKVTVNITLKLLSDDGVSTAKLVTNDYVTNTMFNEKIKEYEASASDTSVKISKVSLSAVIDYATRNFDSLVISLNTDFLAENLSLAYVKGGPVKGTTTTTVTYNHFTEKR